MISEFEAARINAVKVLHRLTDDEEFTGFTAAWARRTLVFTHVLPSCIHYAVLTLRRRSGYTLDRGTAFELVHQLDNEKLEPVETWQLDSLSASQRSCHILNAIRNHHDVIHSSIESTRAKLESLTILPPEADVQLRNRIVPQTSAPAPTPAPTPAPAFRAALSSQSNPDWDVTHEPEPWLATATPPPWITFPADEHPTCEMYLGGFDPVQAEETLSDTLTEEYAFPRGTPGLEERDSEMAIQ